MSVTGQPYIYGAANPIRFSDASGLEPRPIHEGINERRSPGPTSPAPPVSNGLPPVKGSGIPYPVPGHSGSVNDAYDRVGSHFGFNSRLLRLLDGKETSDWLEGLLLTFGNFGGQVTSFGGFNITSEVARGVWDRHSAEIVAYFGEQGIPDDIRLSPMDWSETFIAEYALGSWKQSAENTEVSAVFAGLYLQDLTTKWENELSGQTRFAVTASLTPLDAALLDYRFQSSTVEEFMFQGVDPIGGLAGELNTWNRLWTG